MAANFLAKVIANRTSLSDVCTMSDPVYTYNFDVFLGDKPIVEVMSASVDSQLKLKFLVTEDQQYPDLTGQQIKLVLYQKTGDDPKILTLTYRLDKLVTILTQLDGEEVNVAASIEQLYDYTFLQIE